VKRVASIAERERRVVSFIVGCMGGEGGGVWWWVVMGEGKNLGGDDLRRRMTRRKFVGS